ncbi:hypothetical protein JIN80_06655, partial [Cerasicoccus arenae]
PPPRARNANIGFFESIGLGSFEAAFFAVTLILGGIACLVMQDYWHAIVIGLGALWVFVASWALIVRAFIKHWAWGLAYLFVPFAQLIYIVVDLRNAGKSLVLMLVGIAAMITPIQTESFKQSPIYDQYAVIRDDIQQQIDQQKQEMEQQREQKLDQFDE